jgi:hypothetical protein
MTVILPIRSGSHWVTVAPSDDAIPLQGADLVVGCLLKNLENIIEPLIAEHTMGNADQATTRLRIKTALISNGKLPYFEIGDVHQELDTEWMDLVIKTNTDLVCGYCSFVQGTDPEVLDAYPARELVHVKNGTEPYDWKGRWVESGGQLYSGRMIALKNDPVWLKISDFGHPHPPFAFGSGMDMVDVSRVEAVELGLIGWRAEIKVPPCPICDEGSNSGNGDGSPVN